MTYIYLVRHRTCVANRPSPDGNYYDLYSYRYFWDPSNMKFKDFIIPLLTVMVNGSVCIVTPKGPVPIKDYRHKEDKEVNYYGIYEDKN